MEYYRHSEAIDKLKELETGLNEHVGTATWNAFATFSFDPVQPSNKLQARHFVFLRDDIPSHPEATDGSNIEAFRFWLNQNELFRYGRLTIYFELHGEWAKYGPELRDAMKKGRSLESSPDVTEATASNSLHAYSQIARIAGLDIRASIQALGVQEAVADVLRRNFFQKDHSMVERCATLLSQVGG